MNRQTPDAVDGAMHLIDIGANLTHASFAGDLDEVLDRARAAGVVQALVTGTTLENTRQALTLARSHAGRLFVTAGVHPHHATELDATCEAGLREALAHPDVVAVGETGLDYFRDLAPRPVQRAAFERQLQLAVDTRKPVFLHEREAHEDFVAILRSFEGKLVGAVVHCFTGGRRELSAYLDRGWHIGVTGWVCDERRGQGLFEVLQHIPADRLMIETDAPYLLPRTVSPKPRDPRRNEPMYLLEVAAAVARARGTSLEETAATTTSTARSFFRLPTETSS